jgi:predicted DNA-binding transcriptional regulator YafY
VARQPDRDSTFRHFRLDRVRGAECLAETFVRDPGFSIEAHSRRAFSAWHDDTEFGPVVWRFHPNAAAAARDFCFHPDQVLEPQSDGSLVVRFEASGWLEMAWFLYRWGDAVEVLAPEPLRRMTEDYRRGDFASLP